MTEHLGEPETPQKLRERQDRYKNLEDGERMFKIVDTRERRRRRLDRLLDEGMARRAGLRDRLDGGARVPGPRHRGGRDGSGDRMRQARRRAPPTRPE
jgi:hypothetical protein